MSSLREKCCCLRIKSDGDPRCECPLLGWRFAAPSRARAIHGHAQHHDLKLITCHPHVIGYRSRIWILDELIRHAKSKGSVWFATHSEIVDWAKRHSA